MNIGLSELKHTDYGGVPYFHTITRFHCTLVKVIPYSARPVREVRPSLSPVFKKLTNYFNTCIVRTDAQQAKICSDYKISKYRASPTAESAHRLYIQPSHRRNS